MGGRKEGRKGGRRGRTDFEMMWLWRGKVADEDMVFELKGLGAGGKGEGW